mgnify:CR=1 FL=1
MSVAADAVPRTFGRARLVDETNRPLKAATVPEHHGQVLRMGTSGSTGSPLTIARPTASAAKPAPPTRWRSSGAGVR